MKFLLDQDVYLATARFLKQLEQDVVVSAAVGLSQADDIEVLRFAEAQQRLLVTRDGDFGGLVFLRRLGSGVIYLRVLPSTLLEVHRELERILSLYREDELRQTFVVVEPGRHRVRWLFKSKE
jgi:predicted nuclease of predicted toxin-antitoxin system